jgi:subtilase family serine protease
LGRITELYWLMVVLTLSSFAGAAPQPLLRQDVPAAKEYLKPLDRLDRGLSLDLIVGLPLRDPEGLQEFIRRLYNPASTDYHKFLTPDEFTARFGPAETDYRSAVEFLKTNGFIITGVSTNRMLINIRGTVDVIERVFHVGMRHYRHPLEARTFYSPDTMPSVDFATPMLAVTGLDNYQLPRPRNLEASALDEAAVQTGSGPGGAWMGVDFRKAYAAGVTLDGTGQTAGLLEFNGYYTNDITAYEVQAGLPDVPLSNVLLENFDGSPGTDTTAIAEVSLDIEMVVAMAPGLSQVIVYEARPMGFGNDILNRMANDNLAKQLSCSWSFAIDANSEQIFQQFAAQGQSFFSASGDDGAYSGAIPSPEDDPYITIVGGTTLTCDSGGDWAAETVWNDGSQHSGGGGTSLTYGIPYWQAGIGMSNNAGSVTMRNTPDVAMVADNIYVLYNNGVAGAFSGTSFAAPLWAGFTALVNQLAAANGDSPAGFINPAVYSIGKGSNFAACFHDITAGANTNAGSPNRYYATSGYDLCAGWGTPTGSNLISALSTPEPLRIWPQDPITASGPPGGAFVIINPNTVLTNVGPNGLSWQAGTAVPWLSVVPGSGSLEPGGPAATLVLSLNSSANTLTAGTYTAMLWYTNLTDGFVLPRQVSLQVWQSLIRNGNFETGDFSWWTLSGNTNGIQLAGDPLHARSGQFGAELGPALSLGYLSQNVYTVPGQSYLLSLWLDSSDGQTPNEFVLSWNGSVLGDWVNMGKIGWTNIQYLVVATADHTLLQFGFRDDPSYLGLDDITLEAVSRPYLQAAAVGSGLIVITWTTVPGLSYQLEYATNLASPVWTGSGPLIPATNSITTVTLGMGGDSRRFYRLKVEP